MRWFSRWCSASFKWYCLTLNCWVVLTSLWRVNSGLMNFASRIACFSSVTLGSKWSILQVDLTQTGYFKSTHLPASSTFSSRMVSMPSLLIILMTFSYSNTILDANTLKPFTSSPPILNRYRSLGILQTVSLVFDALITNSWLLMLASMKKLKFGENRKLAYERPCRGRGNFWMFQVGTQTTRDLFISLLRV